MCPAKCCKSHIIEDSNTATEAHPSLCFNLLLKNQDMDFCHQGLVEFQLYFYGIMRFQIQGTKL